MAKKNRRTKNPVPVWGWVIGGLAVVGYGVYWWQDRQRNRATDALYAARAAIGADAVPTTLPPASPVSDAKGATYTRMMETLRKFEEARKAAQ